MTKSRLPTPQVKQKRRLRVAPETVQNRWSSSRSPGHDSTAQERCERVGRRRHQIKAALQEKHGLFRLAFTRFGRCLWRCGSVWVVLDRNHIPGVKGNSLPT